MNGIITAENLPAVIAALLTGLAGLAVWRQGGHLGDAAKHLAPPSSGSQTVTGLAMTTGDADKLAQPLNRIADTLEGIKSDTAEYRDSKTEETLEELLERVRAMTEHDAKRPAPRGR